MEPQYGKFKTSHVCCKCLHRVNIISSTVYFIIIKKINNHEEQQSDEMLEDHSHKLKNEQVLLFGQLDKHWVIEVLVNRNIFRQSLSSTRLDHELTCQMSGRLDLQRMNNN
jgi:hypothetical protein